MQDKVPAARAVKAEPDFWHIQSVPFKDLEQEEIKKMAEMTAYLEKRIR